MVFPSIPIPLNRVAWRILTSVPQSDFSSLMKNRLAAWCLFAFRNKEINNSIILVDGAPKLSALTLN